MRFPLMTCASVALLAGCAHRGPEVVVQGAPLPTAKSFVIVRDRPATGAEPAISAALLDAGLRAAAPDQKPDYLVQLAYADRSAQTGAFVPGVTPTAWLETSLKPSPFNVFRRRARSLNVDVIDTSTGAEVRKVSVREYYREPNPQAASRMGLAVAEALKAP